MYCDKIGLVTVNSVVLYREVIYHNLGIIRNNQYFFDYLTNGNYGILCFVQGGSFIRGCIVYNTSVMCLFYRIDVIDEGIELISGYDSSSDDG